MPYEQWLEWRRKGIGGSDASVVCGINKYRSPIELWLDKTGQAAFEEAGEAAYWGTILEPVVREEFTKRTGIGVKPVKQLLQHEDYPFMLANLDGICETPDHGTCIFEAKTASAFKACEWDDKIPDEYCRPTERLASCIPKPKNRELSGVPTIHTLIPVLLIS